MINILEAIPSSGDASSFYRGRMPLTQLRKQTQGIDIFPIQYPEQPLQWDFMTMFDVAFLQRPVGNGALTLINDCKKFGLPIIADYDDDYFNIPNDHPTYKTAGAATRKHSLKMILPKLDALFVSTQVLKDLYSQYLSPEKIHVIPNALCETVFRDKPEAGKHNFVVWRGSTSHSSDIAAYSDAIVRCQREDWLFNFYGQNPWQITNQLDDRFNFYEYSNIVDYMIHMKALSPKIVIVPLEDTEFNRARAHSAWLEATYAGAIVLAPNWPQWQLPGVINYNDVEDFEITLKEMMDFKGCDFEEYHEDAVKEIYSKFLLGQINKKREEVIHSLIKK